MRAGAAAAAPGSGAGALLLRGVAYLDAHQLPTGEVPSYFRGADGRLAYRSSPFASTLAHDALAPLDPAALGFAGEALALLPAAAARAVAAGAAAVRRRIRAFLAWQELADGRFRFYGRGSGIPPDAATTACAAAALQEGGPAAPGRWRRTLAALARHRAADGRVFTYVGEDGRGWGALDERGQGRPGFDRVVNAHALRFLALAGEPAEELAQWVLRQAAPGLARGTHDHPSPLCFAHAAARAFGQARLPGREELARRLRPRLLARRGPDGGFGGPLSTALALTAWRELEGTGGGNGDGAGGDEEAAPALAAALRSLLAAARPDGSWPAEPYLRAGAGSPPLSTALAVGVLARFLPEAAALEDGR